MLDKLFNYMNYITFTANEFRQILIPHCCLYWVGYNKIPHTNSLVVYFESISIKSMEVISNESSKINQIWN